MGSIRRLVIPAAFIWLAPLMGRTVPVLAQGMRDHVVRDEVACGRCAVKAETRLAFSSAKLEGEINEVPFAVRRDPHGNFWVLSQSSLPRSYSPTGKFTRTFGRSGPGPGEFSWAVEDLFWLPADSIMMVDGLNHRATVFAPDGRYVREIQTPSQLVNGIVLNWPSRVLMSGHVASSSAAGLPLHFVSFAGSSVRFNRSFGPDKGKLRPSDRGTTYHFTGRAPNGTIVTARAERYRIYLWSDEGDLLSTITRAATWFPDSGAGRVGTPDSPPTPAISAIDVDSTGLIWIYLRVAAPTWKRAWARVPLGAREVSNSQLDYPSLYNTRVEVVDPVSHTLVARTELNGLVISVFGNGRVAMFGAGLSGDATLRIDEVRLLRPQRR